MKGQVLKLHQLDEELELPHDSSDFKRKTRLREDKAEHRSLDEAEVKLPEESSSHSHLMSSAFSQFDCNSLMRDLPSVAPLEPRFQSLIDRHIESLYAASNRLSELVHFASARQRIIVTNKFIELVEQQGQEKVSRLDDAAIAKAISLPRYTVQQYEIRLSKLLLKQALKMRPCKDNLLTIVDDKAFAYDLRSRQTIAYRSNVFELSAGITLLNSGSIVITGGYNHPKKCWSFDIKRQKIKSFSGMNEGRASHCAFLLNGLVYVLGGRNERGDLLASTEMWDGNDWLYGPNMRIKREGASAIVIRNCIYVFGGSEDDLLSSGEYFDGEHWHLLDYELPEALSAVGLVAISKSRVLIVGGYCANGLSKAIYELRVRSGKCRQVGTLQRGDIFKSAGHIHEDCIILLGSLGVHTIKEDFTSKFKPYKN